VGALRSKALHVDTSTESKGGKDARVYAGQGEAVTAGNVAKTFVPVTAGDVSESRKRRKGLI
jgi:hypothetical protein